MISNAYKILGVSEDATKEECKKAWRKLSVLHHPDNGGNAEVFDMVQKAWQAVNTAEPFIYRKPEHKSLRHTSLFTYVSQ